MHLLIVTLHFGTYFNADRFKANDMLLNLFSNLHPTVAPYFDCILACNLLLLDTYLTLKIFKKRQK